MEDHRPSHKISIIICTFNPVENIIDRCLESLTLASKSVDFIEFIIVDNNSSNNFCEYDCIVKFQKVNTNVRIIKELKQGLTPARLKGIEEANGELLLFVDDDNFLHPSFILNTLNIAKKYPFIGSFSGQVHLLFEKEPEQWTTNYWGLLVNRVFDTPLWSNIPLLDETMPCGAGLIVRKEVADYYLRLHKTGKRQIQLDRSDNSLFSGGDNDLAICACAVNLGVGLFPDLIVQHFIPQNRLTRTYLLDLAKGIAASSVVLRWLWGEEPNVSTLKSRIAWILRLISMSSIQRSFYYATSKGNKMGIKIIQNNMVLAMRKNN